MTDRRYPSEKFPADSLMERCLLGSAKLGEIATLFANHHYVIYSEAFSDEKFRIEILGMTREECELHMELGNIRQSYTRHYHELLNDFRHARAIGIRPWRCVMYCLTCGKTYSNTVRAPYGAMVGAMNQCRLCNQTGHRMGPLYYYDKDGNQMGRAYVETFIPTTPLEYYPEESFILS